MSSSKSVEQCLIHRMRTQHLDLLVTYGPQRLLDAIRDRAASLDNLEEIGSSDISCWMKDVIDDLNRRAA